MELRAKVIVVTGGASGIGRALAERFATEGAAGIVVADLDGAGAERVAAGLGRGDGPRSAADPGAADGAAGGALGLQCDVADAAAVDALVARAEQAFGPVDLFCANAGVAVGLDLGEPADWDLALAVNTRAHVHAAERLLPGWLERGSGYFLTTASAAGIATQIGSAPYAVTKHAAVAFAEWLSITYGDRGVGVSCLCPMGVRTPLLGSGLEGDELGAAVVATAGAIIEPEEVAEAVVAGLAREDFLILPHPEVLTYFQRKASDYERWLAGMRRLQARVRGS